MISRLLAENLNLPAGIAKESDTEYTIRSLGWFKSPEDIAQMPLGSYNGQLVSLGDVADVRDSHSETRIFTRLNGQPSVGLTVTKQSGANTISTADAVFARVARAQKLYPDLKFGLAYDQSTFIRDSVNNVRDSAIIGGILAVLILLFFLRNVRSTLVVALSIPTSIISTFALLYLCGFTINTMSLGGLALATGLIVDDAVVVLENIFRHIERDKKNATRGGRRRHHRDHVRGIRVHVDGYGRLPAAAADQGPGGADVHAVRAGGHILPGRIAAGRDHRRADARHPPDLRRGAP